MQQWFLVQGFPYQPQQGAHPEHPIYNPPPGQQPPGGGGQPPGVWPGPRPGQLPVMPGDPSWGTGGGQPPGQGGQPPHPAHPIYDPPHPAHPIDLPVGPPDGGRPPQDNQPKPPPADGGWGWSPQFGWGYFPGDGGKPQPGGPQGGPQQQRPGMQGQGGMQQQRPGQQAQRPGQRQG